MTGVGLVELIRGRWPDGSAGRAGTSTARAVVAGLAVGAALAAWVTLWSPSRDLAVPALHPSWLPALELLAAGSALAAAAASSHPQAAPGLMLIAAAVVLPSWAAWPSLPGAARPILLAAAPLAVAGVAVLAASRPMRVAVVLAGMACGVLALGYDPFADPACWETCAQVRPALRGWLPTSAAVAIAWWSVVAGCLMVTVSVTRRRTGLPAPVVAGAVIAIALVLASGALRLARVRAPSMLVAERVLPAAALTLLAAALVVVELRRARALRALRRLAYQLAAPDAALTGSVPGVHAVAFAVPDSGHWVDGAGRELTGREPPLLVLADRSGPVVGVQLSPHTDGDAVLAGFTPSVRLALRNAQLTAVGRARLTEVQESRLRIVRTTDAERRRIERDLHDGAQQRMVSAALHLQVARGRMSPRAAGALGDAEEQLREALARLRRLVHGVFPAALADDGLATALEDLAAGTEVPVLLDVVLDRTASPDVAMAAYATVADSLLGVSAPPSESSRSSVAEPTTSVAEVTVRFDHRALTVRVSLPSTTPHAVREILEDAADRVGALGGTLEISPHGEGAEVRAVIPCASSSPTM